jgi:hypothetical protein
LSELALRRETSFVTFSLHGRLEQVFDLRVRSGLTAFAKAIATFDVSGDTKKFAQRMRLSPRDLIRTPHELWKRLLAKPGEWRTEPQAFGIPAASQIFGRFVRDAGFEAVLYPSQQGGKICWRCFRRISVEVLREWMLWVVAHQGRVAPCWTKTILASMD